MNLARSTPPLDDRALVLRRAFLAWQCRCRQIMMRDDMGRPSDAVTPALRLDGAAEAMGHVITIMSKAPGFSRVPEMRHIAQKTHDPAQRRENALRLFSELYYQKPDEFSDMLTATFPPDSPGAAAIREAGTVRLAFDAYRQRYDLTCRVWRLAEHNPAYQSTWWHNILFNPGLPPGTVILGFEPDWAASSADPDPRPVEASAGPDRF
jgi:hypothetical protein